MAIDPKAAAVEAIAAYLTTALGANVSKVIRGWPESAEDLNLSGKPVISVTPPPRMTRTPCAAKSIGTTTASGIVTHTYRVADLAMTVQIDVWAGFRAHLDDIVPLVEAAFVQTPPLPPELRLTSTGYYSRPLVCTLGELADDLDGDTANKGEWRLSWDLDVSTDAVKLTTHVPQSQVDLEVTTTDGAAGTAITETITAFQ